MFHMASCCTRQTGLHTSQSPWHRLLPHYGSMRGPGAHKGSGGWVSATPAPNLHPHNCTHHLEGNLATSRAGGEGRQVWGMGH
jgi:hypothetical protein